MPTATTTDEIVQPWDRQQGETEPAWHAFRTYLHQGPTRSLASVAQALGKSKTLMDRWSSRWRWVSRVEAYEQHAARDADEAFMRENRQRARRHAELAALHGEALAIPAREILSRLQKDPKLVERLDFSALVRLEATAARAYKQIVVTERLARDMTTENVGGHDGGPLGPAAQRAAAMSDDELAEKLLGAGIDGYRQGLEDAAG